MVKHLNVLFVLYIMAFTIGIINCGRKPRRVMFTDLKDNINENLIKMELGMSVGADGIPRVDIDAELMEDINDEIFVYITFSQMDANGEFSKQKFRQGPTSVCEYTKNPEREPILNLILGSFKQFGNLEFKCPMLKGKFQLKGFFIDGDTLPLFLHEGDYKIDVASYRGKQKVDDKLLLELIVFLNISYL